MISPGVVPGVIQRIPDKMPGDKMQEDKMPENEKPDKIPEDKMPQDKMTDNPYSNPYPRPHPNSSWFSSVSLSRAKCVEVPPPCGARN